MPEIRQPKGFADVIIHSYRHALLAILESARHEQEQENAERCRRLTGASGMGGQLRRSTTNYPPRQTLLDQRDDAIVDIDFLAAEERQLETVEVFVVGSTVIG